MVLIKRKYHPEWESTVLTYQHSAGRILVGWSVESGNLLQMYWPDRPVPEPKKRRAKRAATEPKRRQA